MERFYFKNPWMISIHDLLMIVTVGLAFYMCHLLTWHQPCKEICGVDTA
jgi:hypothetical protein